MASLVNNVAHDAADLHRAVALNENIKQIIGISSEIDLIALNAMLIAKRAGENSRGFGIVSAELRRFSARLNEFMENLRGEVFGLVALVATLLKQSREHNLLALTMSQHDQARLYLGAVTARKENDLSVAHRSVQAGWLRLKNLLEHALRLCETGVALARSGKIEAVYGGAMTPELRQVAERIELTVNEIITILRSLQEQASSP